MELVPTLKIGWLNGWILLCLLCLIEGFLLIVFPKDVVTRLFDRSGWDKKQRTFTVIGKLFSLACLILIILTPLKIGSSALVVGTILYILGLVGLIIAILNFRNTPLGQPVTGGLYRLSRHPQILMLFVLFVGICVAIGSWLALLMLMVSKLVQHLGILAEEEVCLERYGDSYRAYMKRVPRYFLF
ncbi:MAG: isoprenylcysteine carboxylmethyltransferase family protein [Anaerolineales bacterium]|nr:isoprenylcysteine carboxylmethyltransferase family protein [Anaerolineales bacterium]